MLTKIHSSSLNKSSYLTLRGFRDRTLETSTLKSWGFYFWALEGPWLNDLGLPSVGRRLDLIGLALLDYDRLDHVLLSRLSVH